MTPSTDDPRAERRRFRRFVALLVVVAFLPDLHLWRRAEERTRTARARVASLRREPASLEQVNRESDETRLQRDRMEREAAWLGTLESKGIPASRLLDTVASTLPVEASLIRPEVVGDALVADGRGPPERVGSWREALSKRKVFADGTGGTLDLVEPGTLTIRETLTEPGGTHLLPTTLRMKVAPGGRAPASFCTRD